jgi:hypothetical protein
MTDNARTDADQDGCTAGAGSSADQHVTGTPETGDFITDEAPTATTPAHGSSNAGINAVHGNRAAGTDDPDGERGTPQQ